MTEQESKDLEAMKAERTKLELSCISYLRYIATWSRMVLDVSGYRGKTNAEAMMMAFQTNEKRIKTLLDAHLKKYPDEK